MRAYRVIAGVTGVVGVLGAVLSQLGTAEAERTFASTSGVAQSLISIGVPFIGAVAAARRERSFYKLALGYAVQLATVGLVASILVALLVPSTADDMWRHASVLILGAFATQVVAQLVGTGLGLLIGRGWIAAVLTIVMPLGLYAVLSAAAPDARPWLTPYGSAQLWWKGEFGGSDVLPFLVMVALWGLALNVAGLYVARSRRA
ncbi:hypothetical protein ABZS29_13910 [Kribbella sp. NPDC005582]|uniref:hypothetical protein n=1 Tax=Kribbella sp. NPDC005582 TaxID=3156893 RepID=UPI0033BB53C6